MLGIFLKGLWYFYKCQFVKYVYSIQNSFFCKIKVCGKVRTVTHYIKKTRYGRDNGSIRKYAMNSWEFLTNNGEGMQIYRGITTGTALRA